MWLSESGGGGGNNPKSVWWNYEIKAAVRRKEAAWKAKKKNVWMHTDKRRERLKDVYISEQKESKRNSLEGR